MKKLFTLLMVLLLLGTLTACNKQKEEEAESVHVTLNVTDKNGEQQGFEFDTADATLEALLESLNATKILTFEKDDDGHIVSVNGVAGSDADNSSWAVYRNGNLETTAINELTLNDGDVIEIAYVAEAASGGDGGTASNLLGGWTTFDAYNELLTDEESEIFAKAIEGLTGVGYTPIRVLATQVVSGTNYAFLAQGTTVTADPQVDYYIITIYKDLQGAEEIKATNKLDLTNLQTKEASTDGTLGSWVVRSSGKPAMIPGEEVQDSFDQATEKLLGMMYNPLQVLGRQVVNGTNYIALCEGKTVTENPVTDLYLLTWYEDLQGNSTVSDVQLLNLEYYVSGE